jgi:hypothetical protein
MHDLETLLRDRARFDLGDLLLEIYDRAWCAGANIDPPEPTYQGMADLLTTLAELHRVECLTPRGWVAPPRLADELPGWLLSLSQQADVVEPYDR